VKKTAKRRGARKKEIELAYGLLDCAVGDLLAASFLFKPGFYPQSIYHLQQAAEKACKSFFVYTGFLDESQMREAGHDRLKAEPFVNRKLIEVAKNLESVIPGAEREIASTSLSEVLPPLTTLANGSRDSILQFVLGIDEKELVAPFERVTNTHSSPLSINPKTGVSPRNEMLAILHINNIAIVTTPHAWTTRYPTQRKGILQPKDYSRELGIVQAAPELIITLKNAMGIIDQIYRHENLGAVERFMKFRCHPIEELDQQEGEIIRTILRRP
jgi:hypothetical protein